MLPTVMTGAGLTVLGTAVTLLGAYRLGLVRAARKWDSSKGARRVGRVTTTLSVLLGLLLLGAGVSVLASLAHLPQLLPVARTGVTVAAGAVALAVGMSVAARVADRVELSALVRGPSRSRQRRPGAPPSGPNPRTAAAARVGSGVTAPPSAAPPSAAPPSAAPPAPESLPSTPHPAVAAESLPEPAPERGSRQVPAPASSEPSPAPVSGPAGETLLDPVVPPQARPGEVYRDPAGSWYLVVTAGDGHRLVSLPEFGLPRAGEVQGPLTVTGSVELAVWPLDQDPEMRGHDSTERAGATVTDV